MMENDFEKFEESVPEAGWTRDTDFVVHFLDHCGVVEMLEHDGSASGEMGYLMPHWWARTGALSPLDSKASNPTRLEPAVWRVRPVRSLLDIEPADESSGDSIDHHPAAIRPRMGRGEALTACRTTLRKDFQIIEQTTRKPVEKTSRRGPVTQQPNQIFELAKLPIE